VAVTRTPYNTNLIKNPGFEAGPASDGTYDVLVPSWDLSYGDLHNQPTVVAYGTAGGFPTAAEGQRISGGKQFLASGLGGNYQCGSAGQYVAIRGRNSAIDSGHVVLVLKANMGTYDDQTDTAVAQVEPAGNLPLGNGITITATHTNGQLVRRAAALSLPVGTRSFRIDLWAQDTVGYCDAYFDKVSVKLVYV